MAAHGTTEYSVAEGNDYPAHESTYENFLLLVAIGIAHIASICVALAIGGVKGAWLTCLAVVVVATIVAVYGLMTASKAPSYVVLALSLLALALV